MLLFPLNTLPVLGKGKGNKLISIPSARVKAREEFVVMAAVIPQGQSVTLFAGKRKLTLKPSDLTTTAASAAAAVPSCPAVCSGWIVSRLNPLPVQNRQPGKIRKGKVVTNQQKGAIKSLLSFLITHD